MLHEPPDICPRRLGVHLLDKRNILEGECPAVSLPWVEVGQVQCPWLLALLLLPWQR